MQMRPREKLSGTKDSHKTSQIRCFLEICCHDHGFLKAFSVIAARLTRLNGKEVAWKEEKKQAIQKLKENLMSPQKIWYNM